MKLTATLLVALFVVLLFSGGFLLGCDEGGVPIDMDTETQDDDPVFNDEEIDDDEWEEEPIEDFDMENDFGEGLPE